MNILIVEDDAELAETLAAQMADFDHDTTIAGNGHKALATIVNGAFDAVILDRVMPLMDGLTFLQHVRQANINVPVLILTAFGKASQKVEGLEAGADDYVVKPIDPLELNARLHALVRARQWSGKESDTMRAGDIMVSPTKFRAWRNDIAIDLPGTEFKLLLELVRHAGSVLTRPMLLERVWNYDFEPTTNIVDTYIKRLRKKLTEGGGDDPISTLRGVGYMLRK
ncbi:response regulator transcription factor [Sphingobium sufflavum]|nr:response regulator transcription factor [Sphingobium sufflavum]